MAHDEPLGAWLVTSEDMQFRTAEGGIYDLDDDVRIILDLGHRPILKLDSVRTFEYYCPHCLASYDSPLAAVALVMCVFGLFTVETTLECWLIMYTFLMSICTGKCKSSVLRFSPQSSIDTWRHPIDENTVSCPASPANIVAFDRACRSIRQEHHSSHLEHLESSHFEIRILIL